MVEGRIVFVGMKAGQPGSLTVVGSGVVDLVIVFLGVGVTTVDKEKVPEVKSGTALP